MKKIFRILAALTMFMLTFNTSAQHKDSVSIPSPNRANYEKQISLLFGLNQPLVLHGINIEANYWTKRFVFDYSHGFGLEFKGALVSEEARQQHLQFNVRHSLGFGFGYRITKGLNIRLEPKLHIWDVYYDHAGLNKENRLTSYNTFTMGAGIYYKIQLSGRKENFLRGITIVPSIRFWPLTASSLKNNEYRYYNAITEKNEVHKANNIGISNSPVIINISVGYSLSMKNK